MTILRLIALCVFLSASLPSCKKVDDKTVDDLKKRAEQAIKDTHQGIKDLTPRVKSMTVDELEKLFVFEYRVVDLDGEQSSDKIQALLNSLGRERWEAYAINPTSVGIRMYFKRRPRTYLEYVPSGLIW